jgi:hypothetical protein
MILNIVLSHFLCVLMNYVHMPRRIDLSYGLIMVKCS